MYILCFVLGEVIQHRMPEVHVTLNTRSVLDAGTGLVDRTNQIVITGESFGRLVGARIVIERFTPIVPNRAETAARVARSDLALDLVSRFLAQNGAELVRGGMLLESGMYDDLHKISTEHGLWTLTHDQHGNVIDLVSSGAV